ncbi:hypothetical protein DSL72_007054 [Monilinia vaccinii-corymbosi]|uniref:Uncharacterized protein n=1 Tax=Monilinia vaccinii-corymbosi TaxID=61207 RepID=A0A8A3PKM8_9HELO|nr:hypothetical protein DSL72_007054 [Monilinia vaccinii-corymbosi]
MRSLPAEGLPDEDTVKQENGLQGPQTQVEDKSANLHPHQEAKRKLIEFSVSFTMKMQNYCAHPKLVISPRKNYLPEFTTVEVGNDYALACEDSLRDNYNVWWADSCNATQEKPSDDKLGRQLVEATVMDDREIRPGSNAAGTLIGSSTISADKPLKTFATMAGGFNGGLPKAEFGPKREERIRRSGSKVATNSSPG